MSMTLSDSMEVMFTGGFERIVPPDAGHFLHLEATGQGGRPDRAFPEECVGMLER